MIVYNYYTSIIYFYLLTDAVAFRTVAGPFPQLSHVCWSNPILCSLHSNSIYLSLYLYIILYSLFLTVSSSTFIMCILFSLSLSHIPFLSTFSLSHTHPYLSLSLSPFSLSHSLFSPFFLISLSLSFTLFYLTHLFFSLTHTPSSISLSLEQPLFLIFTSKEFFTRIFPCYDTHYY